MKPNIFFRVQELTGHDHFLTVPFTVFAERNRKGPSRVPFVFRKSPVLSCLVLNGSFLPFSVFAGRPSAQAGPFLRVSALASAISDHVVAEPLTDFLLIADSRPSGKHVCVRACVHVRVCV